MFDTKLIQVLRCFDTKEVKKLYEFIDSPFFIKSEKSVKLLYYLKPYFPSLTSKHLDKEKVHQHIFPKTEYNNLRFNRICFEAMDMIEDFLRHYHLQNSDAHINKPLFDFYLKHHLDKHFDALHKSLEKINEKSVERNEEYFFQKWLLASAANTQQFAQGMRGEINIFDDLVNSIDDFYVVKRLNYICTKASFQHLLSQKEENLIDEYFIYMIEKKAAGNHIPVIKMLYHIYLMQKEHDAEQHFEIAAELNMKNNIYLSDIEKLNVYIWLQNFCVRQINKKADIKYENKLFELYKEQLAQGLMYDQSGNFVAANFKNMVQLGLRLQNYGWVTDFIDQYAPKLSIEHRKDTESHAQASLAFAQKDYKQALLILQNSEPTDIFFKLDIKRLLIRTYYEMEEYELAMSTLNTFKVFVHRDTLISEKHKLTNRNFANILTKLIQADKASKIQKLRIELDEMANVGERKWLKAKIESKVAL